MTLRVVRRSSCQVSDWAGGRTVQLEIYPPEAEYKRRNFKFRLSTATCTGEGESPFTELPGIYRHLMILEGELKVRHEDHHEMTLHPYCEVDSFEGSWHTFSQGAVRDFNLMLGEGWSGSLAPITADSLLGLNPENRFTALFCGEGEADVILSTGERVTLGPEDMAVVEEITPGSSLSLELRDGARLVRADMRG